MQTERPGSRRATGVQCALEASARSTPRARARSRSASSRPSWRTPTPRRSASACESTRANLSDEGAPWTRAHSGRQPTSAHQNLMDGWDLVDG
eukprot:9501756-Pyramimonas_sp.AAC.1